MMETSVRMTHATSAVLTSTPVVGSKLTVGIVLKFLSPHSGNLRSVTQNISISTILSSVCIDDAFFTQGFICVKLSAGFDILWETVEVVFFSRFMWNARSGLGEATRNGNGCIINIGNLYHRRKQLPTAVLVSVQQQFRVLGILIQHDVKDMHNVYRRQDPIPRKIFPADWHKLLWMAVPEQYVASERVDLHLYSRSWFN